MPSSGAIPLARPARPAPLQWMLLGAVLFGVVLVYWRTFESLIAVWSESETFAHCFLIVPISVFLIWRHRAEVEHVPKRASLLGLAAILVLSLGWFVASTANVQVGAHFTAVLSLPAAVLALFGSRATKAIAFPLAFLLFAVPFGEALIPALMDITASFTVGALRATGIPVLREGMYFSIPTGDFEVAKACSGIRYLIACSALGVLYSYLSFASWRKRALFIAVSVVAPILANGVRAYLIVMIAHLSDMRYAVGTDHLIYGWIFFGGLCALLFWVGGKFADPPAAPTTAGSEVANAQSEHTLGLVGTVVASIALAAVGPYLLPAWSTGGSAPVAPLSLPALSGAWDGPRTPAEPWHREAPGAPTDARAAYVRGASTIELELLAYSRQTADAETVRVVDTLVDPARWRIIQNRPAEGLPSAGFAPRELVLRGRGAQRVLWYWYVIGGEPVVEAWRSKLLEAWNLLSRGESRSFVVMLSAEDADATVARAALADFAAAAMGRIDGCLESATADCADAP